MKKKRGVRNQVKNVKGEPSKGKKQGGIWGKITKVGEGSSSPRERRLENQKGKARARKRERKKRTI